MRSFPSPRPLLLVLLALCLLLTACAPATADPFAYAEGSFSLSVAGTYLPAADPGGAPRPFTAEITAGPPQNGDPTLRDLTVIFTSPDSLAGLTITATVTAASEGASTEGVNRAVRFTYPSAYGSIQATAEGDELDGLLRFGEGWLPLGDVTEISPKDVDGRYTVTRRRGEREAVFTFVAGETLPTRVRLTDERGALEMAVTP